MFNKINGLLCVVLAATVAFLITRAALAADGGADVQAPQSIDFDRYQIDPPRTWRVRCDQGQTIGRVLRRVSAGDILKITGLCAESIVLDKDGLTLTGENGATIDGGTAPSEAVVFIDGARGVTLEGLVIRNGADQGLLASHQAQVMLKDLDIRENGTVGLSVDRSHFEIDGLTLVNNQTGGMDAYTGSTVVLKGAIEVVDNGGDGLVVNGKSFLELRGAVVEASNNAGSGVAVINDSRLQIFSFPEAQGSGINADSNGFAGVAVLGSAIGVVGSQFFGSGANVISATNGVIGFLMAAGDILSPHATAKFVAENNFVGMVMEDGASALIVGGLNLRHNGTGLDADGAGTLQFVSVPPNPSEVTANGTDVDLTFGTRATIIGVAVDTLTCDATVLLRGTLDLACPQP